MNVHQVAKIYDTRLESEIFIHVYTIVSRNRKDNQSVYKLCVVHGNREIYESSFRTHIRAVATG